MNEKIILSREFFVGNGTERMLYSFFRYYKSLKIECMSNSKINRNQNSLDYKYFKFLENKKYH